VGKRIRSFEEFWPYYVAQHRHPTTRALHFLGSSLVLLAGLLGALLSPAYFALMPFAGYAFAWIGHFFFERNRPATFEYPLWSLRGDARMYRLMLLGRMAPELERSELLFPARG
jgi:hypothetical protein